MDFIAAVVAIVALVFALKMRKRVAALEMLVAALDQRTADKGPAAAAPLPQAPQPETAAPQSVFVAPEPASAAPAAERTDEAAIEQTIQELVRCTASPARPAGAGEKLRRTLRRQLGRVDRRAGTRARRHLHGAVFDRGRPDRPRRARVPRWPARHGADCGRRMDAAERVLASARQHSDREHAGHAHRRRHHGGVRRHLRSLRALRFPRARNGIRAARHRRARDARGRVIARALAGRARTTRRVRGAAARLDRATELLGALSLSRRRDCCFVRARPRTAVALARDYGGGLCRALGVSRHHGCALRTGAGRALSRDRLRARRGAARLRASLWTGRRGRTHRSGLIRRACSLPVRRRRAGAGARS